MPDFIERQECPECATKQDGCQYHAEGCSKPEAVTVRYGREGESTFLGRTAEQWSEIVDDKADSEDRLLERTLRAEAAARDFGAFLHRLVATCVCPTSEEPEARELLARHPEYSKESGT